MKPSFHVLCQFLVNSACQMWAVCHPSGGTGGSVFRRGVANFTTSFVACPRRRSSPIPLAPSYISHHAILSPYSCVQVQMRAREQLPIYTFEGPQVEGRSKFKTCLSSLDVCLWSGVCARMRIGSCQVRPQPLQKLIRTTRIILVGAPFTQASI